MNVKQLKELISDLPDDMEVIIQKDAEGNGFSPLEGGDPNVVYIPDTTWSGDVRSLEWTAEDVDMEEEEWEEFKERNNKSLVLYPVN